VGTGKHKSSTQEIQESAIVNNVDCLLCPEILWTGTGIGTGILMALALAVTLAMAVTLELALALALGHIYWQ
jgi:hypothetical protein